MSIQNIELNNISNLNLLSDQIEQAKHVKRERFNFQSIGRILRDKGCLDIEMKERKIEKLNMKLEKTNKPLRKAGLIGGGIAIIAAYVGLIAVPIIFLTTGFPIVAGILGIGAVIGFLAGNTALGFFVDRSDTNYALPFYGALHYAIKCFTIRKSWSNESEKLQMQVTESKSYLRENRQTIRDWVNHEEETLRSALDSANSDSYQNLNLNQLEKRLNYCLRVSNLIENFEN